MYSYVAYGLGIHSDLPLPELVQDETKVDVTIRLGKVERASLAANTAKHWFWTTGEEMYLYWQRVGTFLIRAGKEIVIDPCPEVEERVLRLFLLGAVLAVLLHQRGLLVLHASAVALNGGAIAFLGGKRWGKSTLAASLHARGHSLISDDIVALDVSDTKSPIMFPAFPRLKLWPDAVASLGDDPETLPRLVDQVEKRTRQITCGFSQRPVLLKRLYVLGRGSTPEIEPLSPQEAMIQLIRHSPVARFGQQFLQSGGASHFLQCAALARNVPTYRLKRPVSLTLLPAIARLVEEHLARDTHAVSI